MRFLILGIILALCFVVMPLNFTYSEVSLDSTTMKEEVESIFEVRNEIWNKFVLGGYKTLDLLEQELKQITLNPLLETDLTIFNQLKYNPTSYELIDDFSIEYLEISSAENNRLSGVIEVNWKMQGLQNNYVENIRYIVDLVKVNGKWMLKDYIAII